MISARTLWLGYQEGAFDLSDVREWIAERTSVEGPIPPTLLDLMPLTGLDASELDARLRALMAPVSREDEPRLRIDVICEGVRRGRIKLEDAAFRFEDLASAHRDALPTDLQSEAAGLQDGLYLASTGTYGTLQEAERVVRDFIDTFGRRLT